MSTDVDLTPRFTYIKKQKLWVIRGGGLHRGDTVYIKRRKDNQLAAVKVGEVFYDCGDGTKLAKIDVEGGD